MNKTLSPGELATGQYVTIFKTKTHIRDVQDPLTNTITQTYSEDRSYYGDVLLIQAVQLPYVLTKHLSNPFLCNSTSKWDTRRTTFMELSQEYIEAATNKKS